jgi:hypothetical protein
MIALVLPDCTVWERMREQLKTRLNDVARVLQSVSALRHHRGLWGQAKVYAQAYAYLHKRSRWMHYQDYKHQYLSIGSGITEAARDVVDARGRTSHLGSLSPLVKWCLGGRTSTVRGCETYAQPLRGHGARYSTGATGGIAHGSEAIASLGTYLHFSIHMEPLCV